MLITQATWINPSVPLSKLYRVVTEGTYAGQVCEIGDLIIALTDREHSGNMNSDWCVAQTNINGAVTGIKSGDAYIDYSQSGSVVTITHKDVSRTDTTSAVSPSHGGTFTAVKSVTSDAKGHVVGVDTETITLPDVNSGTSGNYLPLTGGKINGKLSVKTTSTREGPELRIASNQVDILKTDSNLEDGTSGGSLFSAKGDYLSGEVLLKGSLFKVNSSNLMINGSALDIKNGSIDLHNIPVTFLNGGIINFDSSLSIYKLADSKLFMNDHEILLGGTNSNIQVHNSTLLGYNSNIRINTPSFDCYGDNEIHLRSDNIAFQTFPNNSPFLEMSYFNNILRTKLRGGPPNHASSIQLGGSSDYCYIDFYSDQYHFNNKDDIDILGIYSDGINVNGSINFSNGNIKHNGDMLLQSDGNIRLKWAGLYDGLLSDLTAPLYGGTLNRDFNIVEGKAIGGMMADNDYWRIMGARTGSNAGYLEIATADDATEPIYVRQYSGVFANRVRTLTLLDENGNSFFPGHISADTFWGKTSSVRDSGDGRTLTFNYSANAMNINDITWVPVWNNNELRCVHKNDLMGNVYMEENVFKDFNYIHDVISAHTYQRNFYCIRFNNGIQILAIQVGSKIFTAKSYNERFGATVYLPYSFINTAYVVMGTMGAISSIQGISGPDFSIRKQESSYVEVEIDDLKGSKEVSPSFSLFMIGRWR